MDYLNKTIDSSQKLGQLSHALKGGTSIVIEELWNSPKALILSLAASVTGKHVLILTGASKEEMRLYHDFALFTDASVIDFPAWETMPSEDIAPSPDVVGERYQVLHEISKSEKPCIIISSLQAALQKLIPPNRFQELFLSLKAGEEKKFEELIQALARMGYERKNVAVDKGEFAVRGGIIDVFPVSTPDPYRIEFWGDDIESIRTYDPVGQKSVEKVSEVKITPAKEKELLGEKSKLSLIFDYLGKDTIVVFDDLLALEDRYVSLNRIGGEKSPFFAGIRDLLDDIAPFQKIFFTEQPLEALSQVRVMEPLEVGYYSDEAPLYQVIFEIFNREFLAHRYKHAFIRVKNFLFPDEVENEVSGEEMFFGLSRLVSKNCSLKVLCASEAEKEHFKERIEKAACVLPKETEIITGYLSAGFVIKDPSVVFFPMTEVTRRAKIRRQKQRSTYHSTISEAFELSPGEMVVHLHHGIGKFLGMEKKPNNNGVLTEFLHVEYAEGGRLFVPISQAYLISKYIGASEEIPKMHTIGSSRWKIAKEKTERAIIGYAKDLLHLYAQRSMKTGVSYPEDSREMKSFEEEFPFEETEDQIRAIASIKEDLMSSKSMDRLVCGDVGYGKTEVAMRASFKVAVDGQKQVAVLVPTTVLALQHFETFIDRMRNFPLNIKVCSRFQSAKEIREIKEGLAKGTVDIVIGTHRIISQDVIFKDLGLVIIDEEQRFGVKAKEHLKHLKRNVDTLTLSATPIPRTLYMSLIGARDMSCISTPPQDRLPITTVIAEPSDAVYKTALLRELARDGQAFVIHNRVETIYTVADRIKGLLPGARVVVAHGQMHADEIDSVFHAFKSGKADILVATTIVESGIDIPNANTILIEKADHYGMADLYQLRGRVGRWNRRAYAYMLVKNPSAMSEVSRKRLAAIAESSGYGGGMKVAMRDLEIRGAGAIFGTEQSGEVSAIGFQLYCKLLKRAVQAFQGNLSLNTVDTKFDFYLDARLPEDYVNAENLRLEIYQRLGEAASLEEVDKLFEEVVDRFGKAPEQAVYLYRLTRVRIFAAALGVTSLKLEKLSFTIEKKQGKSVTAKKVLMGSFKSPEELEAKLIKALQSLKS